MVQTVQAGDLAAASARQRTTDIPLPAERGAILDRAGNPLAFSVEARALVTNPRLIAADQGSRGRARYAVGDGGAVAAATGAGPQAVLGLLTSDRGYVVLAKLVDPDVARTVRERFPEIAEERREDRQYPAGTLAANVVGAATWNADERKLPAGSGLESSQNNILAGSDGLRVVDTAEGSNAVIPGSTRFERPATQGSDLQLTLDSDLQYTVQRSPRDTSRRPARSRLVRRRARRAHREVLALANGATFDPRDLRAAAAEQLGNPAVQSPFEPGSVNKIVTMAAALEYGVAQPGRRADRAGQHPGRRPHGPATPGTTAVTATR